MVGVGDHGEASAGKAAVDLVKVRQADRRIGTGNPDRLELTLLQSAKHLDRGQSRRRGDAPGSATPGGLDGSTMVRILNGTVAGQLVRQQTRLTPTHRLALAGQREWARTGLA